LVGKKFDRWDRYPKEGKEEKYKTRKWPKDVDLALQILHKW